MGSLTPSAVKTFREKGARFIRPMMLVVLVLLLGKLISDAVL